MRLGVTGSLPQAASGGGLEDHVGHVNDTVSTDSVIVQAFSDGFACRCKIFLDFFSIGGNSGVCAVCGVGAAWFNGLFWEGSKDSLSLIPCSLDQRDGGLDRFL